MRLFFSDRQKLHQTTTEFVMGALRPGMDSSARTEAIADEIRRLDIGCFEQPNAEVPLSILGKVHSRGLLNFLETLHERWEAAYPGSAPFPEMGLAPGMRRRVTNSLRAQLVHYCFDTCTPVGKGTWVATLDSASSAYAATQAALSGERYSFSLCRPPGHHSGQDFYGGYCFLNNAAIAAEAWVMQTGTRCAIIDVDFHHGNGTQQIFYEREEVFYASLHRSPGDTYPFFSGYEDERGAGAGLGENLNLPIPAEGGWSQFEPTLIRALESALSRNPSALIISLGVDTYYEDPVGGLGLTIEAFRRMGALFKRGNLPVMVILEGGYLVRAVGACVSRFLLGLND